MDHSHTSEQKLLGTRIITSFVVAECLLIAGNLLVRVAQRGAWLPPWATYGLAIASALPMCLFAVQFFRLMRNDLDEMIQRVVLDGLAFALVVFVPLAGLYVNARAAGITLSRVDPPELLMIPSLLAVIGISISWSRLK